MSQVFIVTGAASGIGLALTQQLLKQGTKVCACDIHLAELEKLSQNLNTDQLMVQQLDVRHVQNWEAVIQKVLQQWQSIDVLCNVAGVLRENWVADATENDINLHFDINVKGTILGTQAVLPHMLSKIKVTLSIWHRLQLYHLCRGLPYTVPVSLQYVVIL